MNSEMIKLKCTNCNDVWTVPKDVDAPVEAISMECNYCPNCMDEMGEDYYEKFIYNDKAGTD